MRAILLTAALFGCVASTPEKHEPHFKVENSYLSRTKFLPNLPSYTVPMAYNPCSNTVDRILPAGYTEAYTKSRPKSVDKLNPLEEKIEVEKNTLQSFDLAGDLVDARCFGCPQPMQSLQIHAEPLSSSSSSSSSSSEPECRVYTSAETEFSVHNFPHLRHLKCKYDNGEAILRSRTTADGHTFLLYADSLVVLNCHCNVVKKIPNFYFNAIEKKADAIEKTFTGVDILVNETEGYLLLGLSEAYLVVYKLKNWKIIYQGYYFGGVPSDLTYQFFPSALPVQKAWNVYIVSATQWVLTQIPLVGPCNYEPVGPTLFPMLTSSATAECPDILGPLVINDFQNNTDFLIVRVDNDLRILTLQFKWKCLKQYCSTVALPDCLYGQVANDYGVKDPASNALFISFQPSLDLLKLRYRLPDHKDLPEHKDF